MAAEELQRDTFNVVIVGHVDHGKSTVVGRLLADTGALPQGKLEAVRRECERTGKPFEYAFLLDALSDEQDQGITIDTARCFFKSKTRDYIIIDAPGHIEFLKNMISGAARAEAAVLVIDAKEGVRENSRRHGYILSMLGIRQVVVCVNKMDLVKYDQGHFERIEAEYRAFLEGIGAVSPRQFVPVAAVAGVNLATRGKETPWYDGPTLLELLDALPKAPSKVDQPLRMPLQAVYKFTEHSDDRRIFAGRIEAGKVSVGDKVVFSPSNKISTIKTIEGFNTAPRTSIEAGWSTGFSLSEEIYVTRGEVMSHVERPPQVSTRIRTNLIWLGKKPFVAGRDYKIKLGTAALPVQLAKINKVIDASELDHRLEKNEVGRHDVADVILELRQPVAFDLTADCEATGRFVIVDGYDVAGGGIITAAVSDELRDLRAEARTRDFNWVPGGVSVRRPRRAPRPPRRAGHVRRQGRHRQAPLRARAREVAVRRRPQRLHARRPERAARRGQRPVGRRRAVRAGAPIRRGRPPASQRGPHRRLDDQRHRPRRRDRRPGAGPRRADAARRRRPLRRQHAGLRPAHRRHRARGRSARQDRRPARRTPNHLAVAAGAGRPGVNQGGSTT